MPAGEEASEQKFRPPSFFFWKNIFSPYGILKETKNDLLHHSGEGRQPNLFDRFSILGTPVSAGEKTSYNFIDPQP